MLQGIYTLHVMHTVIIGDKHLKKKKQNNRLIWLCIKQTNKQDGSVMPGIIITQHARATKQTHLEDRFRINTSTTMATKKTEQIIQTVTDFLNNF